MKVKSDSIFTCCICWNDCTVTEMKYLRKLIQLCQVQLQYFGLLLLPWWLDSWTSLGCCETWHTIELTCHLKERVGNPGKASKSRLQFKQCNWYIPPPPVNPLIKDMALTDMTPYCLTTARNWLFRDLLANFWLWSVLQQCQKTLVRFRRLYLLMAIRTWVHQKQINNLIFISISTQKLAP